MAATATALAVGIAAPASAHYVAEGGYVRVESESCVHGDDEISHGDNWGYAKAITSSKGGPPTGIPGSTCGWTRTRPAGYIAVAPQIWQSNGGAPIYCSSWGWLYSSSATWRLTFERTFDDVPDGGACTGTWGSWYGTLGFHSVLHNGAWVGWENGIFSGWHVLPDFSRLPDGRTAPNPPWPEWADPETGIIDMSKAPESVRAHAPGPPPNGPGVSPGVVGLTDAPGGPDREVGG